MALERTQSGSIFVDPGDGTTEPYELSVGYIKNLKVLLSKRISMINAQIGNPQSINYGTAIYYVSRRNITKNYVTATNTMDAVKVFEVVIQLDKKKTVSYTVETMDLRRSGAKFDQNDNVTVSQAFASSWADGASKSIETYMFAEITKGILAVATGDSTNRPVTNLVINDSDGNPITDVAMLRANVWLPIAQRLAQLQGNIQSDYVGLDVNDFLLMISPQLANFVLLSTTTLGGDASRTALLNGEIISVAGVRMMINPLLGRNYDAGVIDQQEAYDLTACDAILIHNQAYAFPFLSDIAKTTLNPNNANYNFIHKFAVNSTGGKALRPSTIWGFVGVNASA